MSDKKDELSDFDRVMFFLRKEYGDGESISQEGMKELEQTFLTSRIINKRANKAKSIFFTVFITSFSGAILWVVWEGMKTGILEILVRKSAGN